MEIKDLYALVEDVITYDKFLNEIEKRREKYGGLLTDIAIAYIIVDEYGKNPGNTYKIKFLIDGINATVKGEVVEIFEKENIKSKDKVLTVKKIKIKDDTGTCIVTFWNRDIPKLENVKIGNRVKIVNGFVKENGYGLTLSLGKWGVLIIE
jgi:ssDNA-binding replication factor A large subunit